MARRHQNKKKVVTPENIHEILENWKPTQEDIDWTIKAVAEAPTGETIRFKDEPTRFRFFHDKKTFTASLSPPRHLLGMMMIRILHDHMGWKAEAMLLNTPDENGNIREPFSTDEGVVTVFQKKKMEQKPENN